MCKALNRDHFLNLAWQWIPKDSVCCEIGVLNGDFSQMILDKLSPKTLILIDPFMTDEDTKYANGLPTAYSNESNYQNVMNRFQKGIMTGNIIIVKNYSYEVFNDPVNNEFEQALIGRCDFIYLDGSHLYEDVKRDLKDWLPKLKLNGLMCGHDYITHEDFGVRQAVDEFMDEYDFEMIILNEQGGDFALKRKI